MSRYARFLSAGADTSDYVYIISRMLFDEPCVGFCVRTLHYHCMRHGIVLRWGDSTPPTPSFAAHIKDVWEPFCREAITSFLAVGFAPFRLRKQGNNMIPEVLPLGTYTWRIARTPQPHNKKRPRENAWSTYEDQSGPPPAGNTEPLLKYEVMCSHCDDTIHVFPFVTPHATLSCYSQLASLIPHYVSLIHQRERAVIAEEWNCKPNYVIQDAQKAMINDVANAGGAIARAPDMDMWDMGFDASMRYQQAMHEMMAEQKARANMPQDTSIFVAPKNTTAHAMDKVDGPIEINRRELHFARSVAQALGIPASFALAGSAAIGSSAAGSSGGAWHDSPEITSCGMSDACRNINRSLEKLLAMAYNLIYGAVPDYQNPPAGTRRMPKFTVPFAPVLPLEHLMTLFDAQLLSDDSYSRLFEVTLGFPMDKENAVRARADRHRAVNILPFKDKKDAPK